jgi:ATP-binding cassette, subfamily B, bacterial
VRHPGLRAASAASLAGGRLRETLAVLGQRAALAARAGVGLVACTVILHVVAGLLPVLFMVGVGQALRSLVRGHHGLPGWLIIACLAFIGAQLAAPLQRVASHAIALRVDAYCSVRLMNFALTRAAPAMLEQPAVADKIGDANEALDHMTLTPGTATEAALALIARYTQLAGALLLLLVVAGPLAALAGAVAALVSRRGQTSAFRQWGRLMRGFAPERRKMAYLREVATSTRTVKEIRSLGLLDWLDQRYTADSRGYLAPLWAWRRRVYGAPFVLYAAITLVATAGALLLLVGHGDEGAAGISRFVIGLQAVITCAAFGTIFPESDVKLVYGRSAWESLVEFERLSATVPAAAAPTAEPAAAPAARARAGARPSVPAPEATFGFDDVSFAYEPGRPVLDHMSLTIPAGQSTAIVGVNGAGKTTLVKVLTGLYAPTSGRVTRDGRELTADELASWQRQFAVTFQDFVRYELTVRENVAMGATDYLDDDDGILAELDRVGLRQQVKSMAAGLDTPLTRLARGGRDISGGQWQRIALARSLFAVRHGARVMVLDEPTAQLDARGEAEFYDAFAGLTDGVTSIIISHRFSSVRRADKILVVERGRVSEAGSHDELVAANGAYATMFRVQAERFAAEGSPA